MFKKIHKDSSCGVNPMIMLVDNAVHSADGSNQWHHQNNLWGNWHSPKKSDGLEQKPQQR